jgi:hypothetical protein
VLLWLAWVNLIGWVHQRNCIQDGLDAGLASRGSELADTCRGMSWLSPVHGLNWRWPPEWEVGYWLIGTSVAAVSIAVVLLRPSRH